MRKPDSICRVCQCQRADPRFDDICSSECAARLSQTEYYEREFRDAVEELMEFEEGVYLPLYLKLTRAEAHLRVLEAGVRHLSLSRSGHLACKPREHQEVREWKEVQLKDDAWTVSITKTKIERLRRRVLQLEREVRGIDQMWKTLSARKQEILEKWTGARGAT